MKDRFSEFQFWGGMAIMAIVLLGPVMGSFALNRKHLRLRPKCRPFAWGYFIALGHFLAPLFVVAEVSEFNHDVTSIRILFGVLVLIYYPLAILTLRRNRIGFLLLTVLSLNPIVWIINGVYLKNRWQELAPNRVDPVDKSKVDVTPSSNLLLAKVTNSQHPVRPAPAEIYRENRAMHDASARVNAPETKVTAAAQPRTEPAPLPAAPTGLGTFNEEALYEQALTELSTNKKTGLWAMALAQTANAGNPDGAYIALRVEQLRQEGKVCSQEQQHQDALAAIARDSRVRLMQQSFYDTVEAVRSSQETRTDFDKYYKALVQSKNPTHAKRLLWLCGYEILNPGDDPALPNSYIVRRSVGDEPIAVFSTESAFVEWAVATFAVRHSTPVGYL